MSGNKGLSDKPHLTQSSYRQAVSATVAGVRNGYTDVDLATRWGVSAGTVNNCTNHKHDLGGLPLLMLADRFGVDALNTVLALVGGKAVPIDAVTVDVSAIPCDVAKVVPLLIELFADGHCSKADVRTLDKAGAIDCLGRVADMLRQRRDGMRLEVVA